MPIIIRSGRYYDDLDFRFGHWTHLELKAGNEMDASLIPPWIMDRRGDHREPSALFITGSADSAVFFTS